MPRKMLVKGLLGAASLALLFGAVAAHAQSQSQSEKQGQSSTQSQGAKGTTGTTGATGTQGTQGTQGTTGSTGTTDPASKAGAESGQGTQGGSVQGSTASGSGAGALSKADQKIVLNMAIANMSEIEAAKIAQSKSQNEQVKNYAQQMIDDHTRALTEVQQLAQSKGVTLPTEPDRAHKAKADKLAAMSGDAFDKAYMAQSGVAEHKKTHSMLTQAQNRAKDPEVKALAARILPTVDQHLNSAKQLHSKGVKQQGQGTSTQ